MIREMTEEDVIRSVHHKYEIPEETVKHLLSEGVRSADIDKAALISCLSGKEIGDILALRKEQPWGRILKNLGLTGTVYEEKYNAHRARRLHRFYGIEEARAKKALEEGYPNHWIRMTYLLEMKTGKKTEDILAMKTKSEKWKPWAEEHLGIPPEELSRWIRETRNPSLKPKT